MSAYRTARKYHAVETTLGMRSPDEIKHHHEFIKTSLFISAVDLIPICSKTTKIIKRFLNRKRFLIEESIPTVCTLNVHFKEK